MPLLYVARKQAGEPLQGKFQPSQGYIGHVWDTDIHSLLSLWKPTNSLHSSTVCGGASGEEERDD